MHLSALLHGLVALPPGMTEEAAASIDIDGLTADSRIVGANFLFAALPGAKADGRAFLVDAVEQGARIVLVPNGSEIPADVTDAGVFVLSSPAPRRLFAQLVARFYEDQPDRVVAVTGTNGKTSTAVFTCQIWEHLGHRAASLGTLGVGGRGFATPGSLTTPDPVTLHRLLAELTRKGCTHLAMEASSHGLDQFRLDGVRVQAAAFTNLSRDHLDYHPSLAAYLAAKTRLFTEVLCPGGTAVLNADTEEFPALAQAARAAGRRVVSYGRRGDDIVLLDLVPTPTGQTLTLRVMGCQTTVALPLVGAFQAQNALAALGLVLADGVVEPAAALAALARLRGVAGRMERIGTAPVYVDYAHTPDALKTVLGALRPHCSGRLVVVFGCGGDRDTGKRPLMGEIARQLADRVIVTDDNPRSEDPAAIRAAILAACPGAEEIGDRRTAITQAVADLAPGDVLLIAGKGHESGQTLGTTTLPFDDRDEARAALTACPPVARLKTLDQTP